MKDFLKEIEAYALQNAIEFGKAEVSKVLPKLFQHGLKKENIKEIMPVINEIVSKVNSLKDEERVKEFKKLQDFVIKKEKEGERDLAELPGSGMKKKMVFRLAPFPSGALHIGNAKTYLLNALYAERYNSDTLLVMDDTIGSTEKPLTKDSYQLIEDAFQWLSVKYKKQVIYKSDRLKIYYKYADELIEKGAAYVCHCHAEELRKLRAEGVECSCRQYPKKIQKARWEEMFKMKEGHATLRIKTSMVHPNPAFRDRVLFKISDREHPRVGNKYRVWPSLEMSWSVDDHLLGITHIIRGNDLAIETDMEKYIWDIFKWKKDVVFIHTGLVRIEGLGAKISKSKAQKEVLSGEFIGWDDPRTWSIQSLARRGIRAEAIREFVKEIGLNKQDIVVPVESLYAVNRKMIDSQAKRFYFVENPVDVEIANNKVKEIEVPVHPDMPKKTRKIKVKKNVSIAEKDFKENKGKEVRLLHLFNVKMDNKAEITSIENKNIPKIQWVSEPVKTKILMFDGTWVSGVAESNIEKLKVGEVVQFERIGFVRYDRSHKGVKEFWFSHR